MLEEIQAAIREGRYRYGGHTSNRMEQYGITERELVACFGHGAIELLEDYPGDRRGHSCLLLGFSHRPLHLVYTALTPVFFITIYVPDAGEWSPDFRERK